MFWRPWSSWICMTHMFTYLIFQKGCKTTQFLLRQGKQRKNNWMKSKRWNLRLGIDSKLQFEAGVGFLCFPAKIITWTLSFQLDNQISHPTNFPKNQPVIFGTWQVFSIVAGILLMGNVEFKEATWKPMVCLRVSFFFLFGTCFSRPKNIYKYFLGELDPQYLKVLVAEEVPGRRSCQTDWWVGLSSDQEGLEMVNTNPRSPIFQSTLPTFLSAWHRLGLYHSI